MQDQMAFDISEIEMDVKETVNFWTNAKYGSEIRNAGSATIRHIDLVNARQERDYKFVQRHVWRSRARRRRCRY